MDFNTEFLLAVVAVFCAGLLRGFSGFGVGMVLVPSLSLLYSPLVAVLTVVLLEIIPSIQLVPRALKHCDWHLVAPISLCVLITVPMGSLLLIHMNAEIMRTVIASLVLLSVVILASGWRFKGDYSMASAGTTGVLSGLISGATSLGGLPVIIYFLSAKLSAERARASIVVFLLFTALVSLITFSLHGLFSREILLRTVYLVPPFIIAIALGGLLFGKASESMFRMVALVVMGSVGVMMFIK